MHNKEAHQKLKELMGYLSDEPIASHVMGIDFATELDDWEEEPITTRDIAMLQRYLKNSIKVLEGALKTLD